MAYNIRNIDLVGLQKKKYFFDANLWLKILKPPFDLSQRDKKYLDFVQKFQNNPNHPKIVVTGLVLSEVINRYLREVSYHKYCKKKKILNPPKSHYKDDYRNSPEYLSDYISLCEDIKAFQNFYELVPDGLGTDIRQKDILTSPPQGLDFNDHYYYKLAVKQGYTIVTDDKDFFVEDVEVLTYNNLLIDRAKNAVQIKKP
jgi:predicted nucleic acid-binding protein